MKNSRTVNSKRNIFSGLVKQLTNIILPFVTRTIVLYMLGASYQGLNSLFTSILQVLNLADLGFSSAVVVLLYKPIAEDDTDTVCAVIAFLRHIYKIVGCAIFVGGLCLLPFLPNLISGSYPNDINIYSLYILYLLNATISYFFFGYKSALLIAMQREYIISNISTVTGILYRLIQIMVLVITKNYYAFIVVMLIGTMVNNFFVHIFSKHYFPDIIPTGTISSETRFEFNRHIRGILINKIGDTARNSFDNIILSALLGLTAVAIYGNYYYIYNSLYGITLVIIHAMQASVGNSIVLESREKNYKDLQKFTFVFSWFTGWFTICLLCIYQPFMYIWMRHDNSMMLSNLNMILFSVYFYAITMNNTRNLYVNGKGLFWELRKWYIFEAIGNLVLNVVLGYFFGITGIIVATIVTIVLFNFIARTNVLFCEYFERSPKEFYGSHMFYLFTTIIAAIITFFVCNLVPWQGVVSLVVKGIICVIIPNIIYVLVYRKNKYFVEAKLLFKKIVTAREN